jgi:hypothetical protein
MRTEYASADQRGLSAYEGLAKQAGVTLETVVEHAEAGRLGELIESRTYRRPLSGVEALRRTNEKRHAPGTRPKSGAAALGELRAWQAIWDAEGAELRRRDPHECLTEILARRVPRWEQ